MSNVMNKVKNVLTVYILDIKIVSKTSSLIYKLSYTRKYHIRYFLRISLIFISNLNNFKVVKKNSPQDWPPFPTRYGVYRIECQAFGCEFEELVVGKYPLGDYGDMQCSLPS